MPSCYRFVCKNNGVLFENQLLQIGIKSEYRQNLGKLLSQKSWYGTAWQFNGHEGMVFHELLRSLCGPTERLLLRNGCDQTVLFIVSFYCYVSCMPFPHPHSSRLARSNGVQPLISGGCLFLFVVAFTLTIYFP